MTVVRDWNDFDVPGYAALARRTGRRTMVEVKSYMHLGPARKRLGRRNMLEWPEIRAFAQEIADELGWQVIDEAPNSLIALVCEEDYPGRVMDFGDPITGHLEPEFSC
jgi:tRNA wybutosine-synthesizing protein 1